MGNIVSPELAWPATPDTVPKLELPSRARIHSLSRLMDAGGDPLDKSGTTPGDYTETKHVKSMQ